MFKKKTIRVEFYNAETGEKIGYDDQKLKHLPEDFEPETFVEIDGVRYEVVRAEPDERRKIKKSGSLMIQMKPYRKKEPAATANGEEVVEETGYEYVPRPKKTFVSPTRPDIFPAFTGQREGLKLMEMGTWEWRSVEFIDASHELDIKNEFASIRDLKRHYGREENGREVYSRQHRRSLVDKSLGTFELDFETLANVHFPGSTASEGITFMGSDGYADGGFALRLAGGLIVYGLAFGDRISALGLTGWQSAHTVELAPLEAFMQASGMLLVDWEALVCLEADAEVLAAWLSEKVSMAAVAAATAEAKVQSEEGEDLAELEAAVMEVEEETEETPGEMETMEEAEMVNSTEADVAPMMEVVKEEEEQEEGMEEAPTNEVEEEEEGVEEVELENEVGGEIGVEEAAETAGENVPELRVVDLEAEESGEEE